jgi:hypothetical protein
MQLSLKEVSFWYKDKASTFGSSEYNAPKVSMWISGFACYQIPEGLRQREHRGGFHFIERVEVKVAEEIGLKVKESNHPILLSMFKPIFMIRFREALAKTFEEQIRWVWESADSVAWDVGKRSEVFSDARLESGSSVAAAVWTEIGRLRLASS